MLDLQYSRARQKRLAQLLAERGLGAAVCGSPAHVYYFTGFLTRWTHHSAVVVPGVPELYVFGGAAPGGGRRGR